MTNFKEGQTIRRKNDNRDKIVILSIKNSENVTTTHCKNYCSFWSMDYLTENFELVPDTKELDTATKDHVLSEAITICEQAGLTVEKWKPTIGKQVFIITGRGYVTAIKYEGTVQQDARIAFLGGYRTQELAEQKRDEVKELLTK